MIGILLVRRSELVEDNAVEVFHHYGVQLSSSFLNQNYLYFQISLSYHSIKPVKINPFRLFVNKVTSSAELVCDKNISFDAQPEL